MIVILCHFLKHCKIPWFFFFFNFLVCFINICASMGSSNLPFLSMYFVRKTKFPHQKPFQPSLLSVSTENSFLELRLLQDFRKLQQHECCFYERPLKLSPVLLCRRYSQQQQQQMSFKDVVFLSNSKITLVILISEENRESSALAGKCNS